MYLKNIKHVITCLPVAVFLLTSSYAYALTIDQAIGLAKENLPSYKANTIRVDAKKNLYNASFSSYLPQLDISGTSEHLNTSSDGFDLYNYDTTLSYTLFDGGKRKSARNIAKLNFDSSSEEQRNDLIELTHNVKVLFFTVVSKKENLEQRKRQVDDAKKNYDIAQAKHQFGKALRSDVLQASVSLTQSKFDLRKAMGELAKSIYELNSFIGRPIYTAYYLEYAQHTDITLPDKQRLVLLSLERPAAIQAQQNVKISKNNISIDQSLYYPTIFFDITHTGSETFHELGDKSSENKSAALIAKWNLFKWDKYYKKKSSVLETHALAEQLSETKRQLVLEVNKTYEDYSTNIESLTLAKQQMIEAQFNYEQAFGEYKAGKGDILSLVRAATLLSDARITVSTSKLDFELSKAAIELTAGIENIETMKKITVP
jgi:outer membrane protein TolC